jgi:uncharacterized delta-60 repeat protein
MIRFPLLLGVAAAVLAAAATPARADDGAPDPAFGTGGSVLTALPFSPGPDAVTVNSLLTQPDGRLIAVGAARFGGDTRFLVARYLPSGAPDPAWGTGGIVLTDFPDSLTDSARSATLQPDGKLVVAGSATNADGRAEIALARYFTSGPATGRLDPTLGRAGLLVDPAFGQSATATAVFVEPGSVPRLRVFGALNYSFDRRPDAVRALYDLDGTAIERITDGDFAGIEAATPFPPLPGHYITAGFGNDNRAGDAHLRPEAFAVGADAPATRVSFPGASSARAFAVTMLPNGGVIAAGSAVLGGRGKIALAAFRVAGLRTDLDTSYGQGGLVVTDVFNGNSQARAIVAQPDGKVVIAGTAKNGGNDFFVLARYTASGALDPTFGGDGIVTTLLPGVAGQVPGGLALVDGRLIAAGGARLTSGAQAIALARYGQGPCTALLGCTTVTMVRSLATVNLDLRFPRNVGIVVRRVGPQHRLTRVGRVPFGPQHAGNLHIRWNLRVAGHRLPAGRYEITVRALRGKRVVAVSRPIPLRARP